MQTWTALRLARKIEPWLPHFEAAPEARAAWQQLLGGPTAASYDGILEKHPTAAPDSSGRARLRKGAVCPLKVKELDLPAPGSSPVDMTSLSTGVAAFLDDFKHKMLRRDDQVDWEAYSTQRAYGDPVLKSKKEKLALTARLWACGALGFVDTVEEEVELFSVVKKYDDDGLLVSRPVWDLRKGNMKWHSPPFVPLGSPASFVNLDLSDTDANGDPVSVTSVTGDISAMFTRCQTPPAIWPWFTLGGISIKDFVKYMAEQGVTVIPPEGAVALAVTVLLMGWSWAPFLCQTLLCSCLDAIHGPEAEDGRRVYGCPTPQLAGAQHAKGLELISWAYMDDFGAAATTGSCADPVGTARSWLQKSRDGLTSRGFLVHKEEETDGIRTLGAVAEPGPYSIGLARPKIALLKAGTEDFVRQKRIWPEHLEKIVGLWSWALLFQRCALSFLDETYHFIRNSRQDVQLWLPEEVRQELLALAALSFLLFTNMQTPWLLQVFATDSCDKGFGVVKTEASLAELRAEARHTEMRGWTVALEDTYADIEESIWQDDDDARNHSVHDLMDAARPEAPSTPRVFRVLHLFAGDRREKDV